MTVAHGARGVSHALANCIVSASFADLDEHVVRQTRFALLDALGVSIAATRLGEGVATFIDWVREQGAHGRCRVLAQDYTTSTALAAFANGALAHALDFEDAHDVALVHPNAAVIPAALAVAQARGDVTGKELLTAIAVGCEVTCRLGFAVSDGLDQYGWYPPPIFSAYGATAAAAKLLGLDEQQILDAFSLTLSQATCSAEIKHNTRSQIRAIRDAFPAQTGVVSAELADKGLNGFSYPFEGEDGFFAGFARGEYDADQLTTGLGESYAIADISFKPWPSCRGTHSPIELTLNLCRKNEIDCAEIKSITVFGNNLNRMLAEPIESKRSPGTAIDAKFSIPFCVAAAVVNGRVDLDSFSMSSLHSQVLLDIASRVSYRVDGDFDSPLMARVHIVLRDGRSFAAEAENAQGCPSRPLTEQILVEKFTHCLSHSANQRHRDSAGEFARNVLNIDQLDHLDPFFNCL